MPFLIYLAGVLTLGPYEGGLLSFLGSLLAAFFTLTPTAWLLVAGPYLLFTAVRLLTRPLRRDRLTGYSSSSAFAALRALLAHGAEFVAFAPFRPGLRRSRRARRPRTGGAGPRSTR